MPTVKIRVLGLIAVLASGVAAAQTPPAPPADGGPDSAQRQARREAILAACDADIKSLCADQHVQLSSGCKSAMPMRHSPGGTTPAPST
jgi:hypothetical protein